MLGEAAPLRPIAVVRLRAREQSTRVLALVDSGSERCLAAPGVAREIGVNLDSATEVKLGIGGAPRRVRFADVQLELFLGSPGDDSPPIASWTAPVGFLGDWEPAWPVLLGEKGFFDQFTVTMHRSARAFVVEPWEAFDQRFGVMIEIADKTQPRFHQ